MKTVKMVVRKQPYIVQYLETEWGFSLKNVTTVEKTFWKENNQLVRVRVFFIFLGTAYDA